MQSDHIFEDEKAVEVLRIQAGNARHDVATFDLEKTENKPEWQSAL